jgi:RNA polymerase sigma factor (sigma-70 family)
MDQVSDDKNKDENWLDTITLSDGMDRLNEREQRILNLRFFEGKTQMEVAGEIGISQDKKHQTKTFTRNLSAYRGYYEAVFEISATVRLIA